MQIKSGILQWSRKPPGPPPYLLFTFRVSRHPVSEGPFLGYCRAQVPKGPGGGSGRVVLPSVLQDVPSRDVTQSPRDVGPPREQTINVTSEHNII